MGMFAVSHFFSLSIILYFASSIFLNMPDFHAQIMVMIPTTRNKTIITIATQNAGLIPALLNGQNGHISFLSYDVFQTS